MPHCTNCGTEVAANAQFCPTCGQPQTAAPAGSWQPAASTSGAGMSENTAACLSYVLGWLTGIIFFFIDKRPYVRFHAAQSIVTFGGLHVIRIVLAMIFGVGWMFGGYGHWGYATWGSFGIGIALLGALSLLTFILWIVCMIKAATGSRFVLPIAGPIAQNLAGQ
ncbi:MAG: zinc-ribbon domain-containing protein [Candidatus Korobacteraceae bacterium]